jgi:hypothetical protein
LRILSKTLEVAALATVRNAAYLTSESYQQTLNGPVCGRRRNPSLTPERAFHSS